MTDHIRTRELEPQREKHDLGDVIRLPHPEGHDILLTPEAARHTGYLLQRLAETIQHEHAEARRQARQNAQTGK